VDDGVRLVLLGPMVIPKGDIHVVSVHSAEVVLGQVTGARFCERVGTLGGDGWIVLGVTTFGSNGALVTSCV
jgi:hypothetical protein